MSTKHHISIQKTATYYVLGDLSTARTIWFVLHGYGYAAEYFVKKFEPLLNEEVAIIAPEGLSRFYIEGVDGKVGASWMTKIDREIEIKDYVNYLNQLYDEITLERKDTLKVNLLGFSQGGATVCRWVSDGYVRFDNLILWATGFPNDMHFDQLMNINVFFVYGTQDKYLTAERIEQQKAIIDSSPEPIVIDTFEGDHNIPVDILVSKTAKFNW